MRSGKRLLSLLLTATMLVGMTPMMQIGAAAAENPVKADNAGKAMTVLFDKIGEAAIGNQTVEPGNLIQTISNAAMSSNSIPGVTFNWNDNMVYSGGSITSKNNKSGSTQFTIRVAENPILRDVTASGQAEFFLKGTAVGDHGGKVIDWNAYGTVKIIWYKSDGSTEVLADGKGDGKGDGDNYRFATDSWLALGSNDIFVISVGTHQGDDNKNGATLGVEGFEFQVRDIKAPTATYTAETTGTVNSSKQDELLLKLGVDENAAPEDRYPGGVGITAKQEYVDINVAFSEPVQTENANRVTGTVNVTPAYTEALNAANAAREKVAEATTALQDAQDVVNTANNAKSAANSVVSTVETTKKVVDDIVLATSGATVTAALDAAKAVLADTTKYPPQLQEGEDADGNPVMVDNPDYLVAKAMVDAMVTSSSPSVDDLKAVALETGIQQIITATETAAGQYTTDKNSQEEVDAAAAVVEAVKEAANPTPPETLEIPPVDTEENKPEPAEPLAPEGNKPEPGEVLAPEENKDIAETEVPLAGEVPTGTDSLLAAAKTAADRCGPTEEQNGHVANAQAAYNTANQVLAEKQKVLDKLTEQLTAIDDGKLAQFGELLALGRHDLFTNTLGTGYLGSGKNRGLELYKILAKNNASYITEARKYADPTASPVTAYSSLINKWMTQLSYRYSAQRGDFNGNNAIGEGGGIEAANHLTDANGAVTSLLDKLNNAGFHDAAGNPVIITDANGNNPFDKADGGHDVIVDAEPPTYTRVGNGITPQVLTGLILNKKDALDFTVAFSEAVMAKRSLGADGQTYILFNNDNKAYFRKKSADGKQWTFDYEIPDGKETETPLWKAIALTHDGLGESQVTGAGFGQDIDGRCITDYVGNVLADRANVNADQVNSSISWAKLALDNTPPTLAFTYGQYAPDLTPPTDGITWGQAGRIKINASDADIATPVHDPDQTYKSRPSKGIYRPDNMTGGTPEGAPAVGLVYYTWTRAANAPLVGENYEAIKRYSLTGLQPNTVTERDYAAAWKGITLLVANNTSSIVPPKEAMTTDNGDWYLHVWTADMSWDSARQRMQYDLTGALKYKDGLDNAGFLKTKFDAIDAYRAEHTTESDDGQLTIPSYDTAWDAVKQTVYTTVFTEGFLAWLDASGSDRYSDNAMVVADTKAMTEIGQYDKTSVWTLDKYAFDDSNWVAGTARILFDNKAPAVAVDFANKIGDNSKEVRVPVKVTDENSGLNVENSQGVKLAYQWVSKAAEEANKGKAYAEVNWVPVTNGTTTPATGLMTGHPSVDMTATTLEHVEGDGEYYLYVMAVDMAGNPSLVVSDQTVKVNAARSANCSFGSLVPGEKPELPPTVGAVPSGYVKSLIPTIKVTASDVQSLSYRITNSPEQPTDGWIDLNSTAPDKDGNYTLSEMKSGKDGESNVYKDGTWYIHVKVVEKTNGEYFFRQSVYLDNTLPTVGFSQQSAAIGKNKFSVVVDVADALSGIADPIKSGEGEPVVTGYADIGYQWLRKDVAAPTVESKDWKNLPTNKTAVLDETYLSKEERSANFILYIKAADKASNSCVVRTTGDFRLEGTAVDEILPTYKSSLIYAYEAEGAVQAVASLDLQVDQKDGYRYSISTDGGETWCNWLPYMSFVQVKLVCGLNEVQNQKLQVKFRSPKGNVGEPIDLETKGLSTDSENLPLYATAAFDSSKMRKPGVDLTLMVSKPESVTLTAVENENLTPQENGNFTIRANGVYSFTLTKEGYQDQIFDVVVDLFDDAGPIADVSYSTTKPTNGSVVATLETVEDVHIISGGRSHTFTENGTFDFAFTDEAGNEATITATVGNIDRNAPKVEIKRTYTYGEKNEKTFGTLGSGADLLAQGMTLHVVSADGSNKKFSVVSGDQKNSMTITKNGTYSFTVADAMGNTATVTETVTNIVNAIPKATVKTAFVDTSLPSVDVDGVPYSTGDVFVTLSISADKLVPGNQLYAGTIPAEANALKLENGSYTLSKTFSAEGNTNIAVCDKLGNVARVPVTVKGIDKKKPTITLNKSVVPVTKGASVDNLQELLGGYTAKDNVKVKEVTITPPNTSTVGKQTVTYTVTDMVGHTVTIEQTVVILPSDGLLVTADGVILSASVPESALLPTNEVNFVVDKERMQQMFYQGKPAQNEAMRYDLYYVSGLYREGQLKYIANQITSEELEKGLFTVTFDKPGWYTIIIRNQERTREYTTFFISSVKNDGQ